MAQGDPGAPLGRELEFAQVLRIDAASRAMTVRLRDLDGAVL